MNGDVRARRDLPDLVLDGFRQRMGIGEGLAAVDQHMQIDEERGTRVAGSADCGSR